MSSEQKALEIIKILAKHIQEADANSIPTVIPVDALLYDDETTLSDAILAAAGVGEEEPVRDIDQDLKNLVTYLQSCRPKAKDYSIVSVGEKMAKIGCNGGGSVHCFVAVTNFANKSLGIVKAGQIFKPASWKAPAKHARGDLFDINTWHACFTDYGVRYLN